MTIKNETGSEVVETRVKTTIIRRRAKVEAVEQLPIEEVEESPPLSLEFVPPPPPPPPPPPVKIEVEPEQQKQEVEPEEIKNEPPVSENLETKQAEALISPTAGPVVEKVVSVSKSNVVDEDRPRYGLRIVGRMELKPTPPRGPAPQRSSSGRPGPQNRSTPSSTGPGGQNPRNQGTPSGNKPPLRTQTTTTLPPPPSKTTVEDELAKKLKSKKGVKKPKNDGIEVDLDGIGKVSTLTQLTRLASATPVADRVERERVFEPSRSSGRMKKKMPVRKEGKKTEITQMKASKRVIGMKQKIAVGDLAHEMGLKVSELIKKLMGMGSMVTINQSIDFDTAQLVANEFGYEMKQESFNETSFLPPTTPESGTLEYRSPIVTVMGHVDHGKTSLLDTIRKSKVALGEAGGITQHIGAYRVKTGKGSVTFLDTPGHEAFTAMRARGASLTDVVILVVAADDGVMPQTIEAIHHAQAAKVPIIVAMNKIDKPAADPEKLKRQLTEHQLVAEDWGGETIVVPVSAKTGVGIDHLLEMVLLQSEVLDLKADFKKPAKGIIVESRLDKGRGTVATVLIQEGELKRGDAVVTGSFYGRVRGLWDDQGKEIQKAGPSDPVELIGLSGVPNAGDVFQSVVDEKTAKMIADHRMEKEKQVKLDGQTRTKLENLFSGISKGEVKELRMILKGDVQGSIEALRDSLVKLSTEKVKVQIIHSGVGGVTESDVMLASASDAIVIGFNVRPDLKAKDLAQQQKIEIKLYNIIYNALDEIKKAMEGLLQPIQQEKYLGRAEVRQVFQLSKSGTIAGCFIVDGLVQRSARVRLLRNNIIVFDGKLSTLKRFKDDVKEVAKGYECGMALEGFQDIKTADVIEAYIIESIAAKL